MTRPDREAFDKTFPDEAAAARWFAGVKWPAGPCCEKCGGTDLVPIKTRPEWLHCRKCKAQPSIKAGTFMHRSQKPLLDWLYTIWRVANERRCSARRIRAELGYSSYGTAWTMLHKVRAALADGRLPVDGPVVTVGCTAVAIARQAKGDPPLEIPAWLVVAAGHGPRDPVQPVALAILPPAQRPWEELNEAARLEMARRPAEAASHEMPGEDYLLWRHRQEIVARSSEEFTAFVKLNFGGVSRRYLQNYVAQFVSVSRLTGPRRTLEQLVGRMFGTWIPSHDLRTPGREVVPLLRPASPGALGA